MNSILKVTILITTMEVAQARQYVKHQPHIILDMKSNSLYSYIPIMMLVHTN